MGILFAETTSLAYPEENQQNSGTPPYTYASPSVSGTSSQDPMPFARRERLPHRPTNQTASWHEKRRLGDDLDKSPQEATQFVEENAGDAASAASTVGP